MHVVVYGAWRSTTEVTTEVEGRYASSFRPDDQSACVWTEPEDHAVLMIGFDVEAVDLEAAIRAGRAEILVAAQAAGLSGELRKVTSMTDEGYRTWSAESSG